MFRRLGCRRGHQCRLIHDPALQGGCNCPPAERQVRWQDLHWSRRGGWASFVLSAEYSQHGQGDSFIPNPIATDLVSDF